MGDWRFWLACVGSLLLIPAVQIVGSGGPLVWATWFAVPGAILWLPWIVGHPERDAP